MNLYRNHEIMATKKIQNVWDGMEERVVVDLSHDKQHQTQQHLSTKKLNAKRKFPNASDASDTVQSPVETKNASPKKRGKLTSDGNAQVTSTNKAKDKEDEAKDKEALERVIAMVQKVESTVQSIFDQEPNENDEDDEDYDAKQLKQIKIHPLLIKLVEQTNAFISGRAGDIGCSLYGPRVFEVGMTQLCFEEGPQSPIENFMGNLLLWD